ncbi:hypothetical protein CVT26_007750 [Gymnopilus dilepis]|uniref:Uncharacterized protein n=1 Tax=Gymnopilus dilepis TaxID=231916 RepID=A0A409WSG4_9AGAR|nr:hypothetical protein CVT26_007750 [Gymnopilus dilepis]
MSANKRPRLMASDTNYMDYYRRQRDNAHALVVESHQRLNDDSWSASDARALAELTMGFKYRVPGLHMRGPRTNPGNDANGKPIPTRSIITSPNMDTIPDLSADDKEIRVRTDGRFYTADFTLFPQWFFPATPYLPYVLARPPADELKDHKYYHAWYDMKRSDFLYEEDSAFRDVGLLKKDIVSEFNKLRTDLEHEFKAFMTKNEFDYNANDYNDLLHCAFGMKNNAVILRCAPQSYNQTLLTVTSFQRYFLECLAIFDYLRHWKRAVHFLGEEIPEVRHDLVGAVTYQLEVAQDLYMKGVPVWLVRKPEELPSDMNIITEVLPRVPQHLIKDFLPGYGPIYNGDITATRSRAVHLIKPTNIRLGHSSYVQYVLLSNFTANAQHYGASSTSALPPAAAAGSSVVAPPSAAPVPPAFPQNAAYNTPLNFMQPLAGSSLPTVAFVPLSSSERAKLNINPDKFKYSLSDYQPAAIRQWVKALTGFAPKKEDLLEHPNFHILRGYAFLDPFIFGQGVEWRAVSKFITLWLSIRSVWLVRAATREDDSFRPFPKPQEWKDFLLRGVGPKLGLLDPPKTTTSADGKARRGATLPQLEQLFNLRLKDLTPPSFIAWNGKAVLPFKDILRAGVDNVGYDLPQVREIVWDMTEHNFRMELVSLDYCIHPRRLMQRDMAEGRDADLCDCFQGDSVIMRTWPADFTKGLGAREAGDRWEYVEAFRKIVCTWPHTAAGRLRSLAVTGPADPCLSQVEAIAFPIYVELFFRFFGRAPTIPRVRL